MLYGSYTMDTSGLTDMYTRGLRVYKSGKPRVDMICIIATQTESSFSCIASSLFKPTIKPHTIAYKLS